MTEQEQDDAQVKAKLKAIKTIHDSIDVFLTNDDVESRADAVMNLYGILDQVKEWKTE